MALADLGGSGPGFVLLSSVAAQSIPGVALMVNDSAVWPAQAATLGKLARFRHLRPWGEGITDAGLEHVAWLRALQTLSLSCTQITDTGLARVARLQRL